jgi:magnesium chelatase subunit D
MTALARPPRDAPEAADAAAAARWDDALEAASLLAIDPAGLGGAVLRGGPGPAREAWLTLLRAGLAAGTPVRRMPAGIEDDRLLGGLDLATTLSLKRPVVQNGLLAEADGGLVIMPGAERIGAGLAAKIAGAMARREIVLEREGIARRLPARFGIVVLDEGASETEAAPAALVERCAFLIDCDAVDPGRDAVAPPAVAGLRVDQVGPLPDALVKVLATTAAAFGIASLGAVLLAMRVAVAAAARAGRAVPSDDDAALAARLVLGPRATRVPQEESADDEPEEDQSEPETPPESDDQPSDPAELQKLEDMIREAVQTALPADLLKQLESGKTSRGAGKSAGGGGKVRKSPLRGRPLGSRAGTLRPGARLALVDTLRAAAPWQGIRQGAPRPDDVALRIQVRQADFRIKRFAERREATIVFCVDASGSAAFHRLAEAKGAVELLLAEAYVARTHAALVVFRGTEAEVLLPPTRSVARARALLADLPGGGGTPLAAGLDAGLLVALAERAKGRDPLLVVLTDGSANIARDGTGSRARAGAEAMEAARRIAEDGIAAVFIDNAPRPRPEGSALAAAMGARFVALPYLEANAVRDAVRAARP